MSVVNSYAKMKGDIANHQQNILENSMLFKIELADGTSQLIQVPKIDVCNLGLQVQTEPKVDQVPRVAVSANRQLQSDNLHEENKKPHFVYKIIKPEDLNLKPSVKTHLTRGRPRKRVKQNGEMVTTNPIEVTETKKVIKQARTRSGRITKPPKHIEKDFKKIDITDDGKLETDLKTCEFEPLRTNDTPSEEPLLFLEQHTKKRSIPWRFRCPTCHKAYLGRIKMINHFQKHPEHRTASTNKLIHHTTWNFLVLTSQKHKYGSKGIKFCEELEVLIQNARFLAHYLFKPVTSKDKGYLVNETLACLFGINPGKYTIDETELNRDVTLCEYLESNDGNSSEVIGNVKKDVVVSDNSLNSFGYMMSDNAEGKKHFTSGNIVKDQINLNHINLSLERESNQSDIEFTIADRHEDIILNKDQLKPTHPDLLIPPNSTVNNGNCLALVKYEMQPKTNFVFNPDDYNNIDGNLHSVIDTNQLESLTKYNNLEVDIGKGHGISEKQNSHITLQNELRDVDDLMLVNVDTGQVSNILDTSSNSDDIMNVDQFVNERFKKLTEPDIDIQNNLLNLELPPLDMFNFHTS